MERLLNFVYQYRAFFTFLVLQLFCGWLIVENNQYQNTKFFNSSNRLAANIAGFSQGVREYFALRKINVALAEENARLRTRLEQRTQSFYQLDTRELRDPAIINRFEYVSAKVVSNSTHQFKNYITIDKGQADGVQPGMAVISHEGAVGKVKSTSQHFSVLISLLNIDEHVSAMLKRTGHFGTVQWDGLDPRYTQLRFIPRHVNPLPGDTVVTSGYNAIFPPGILVGIVQDVKLKEEAPFYEIKVELAQDFGRLAFVDVVKSNLKAEQDSLETKGEMR
jgi:rod shape-determining protein MreC